MPIGVPWPPSAAVAEFRRGWNGRFGLTLAITGPPDQHLRGVLHLGLTAPEAVEVSYGVAPQHRGQGLATRAVRLAEPWVFAQVPATRVEIVVAAGGVHGLASRRVAENAGFFYATRRCSHAAATGAQYDDPVYVLAASGPIPTDPAPSAEA